MQNAIGKLVLWVCLICLTSACQTTSHTNDSFSELEAHITKEMKARNVPGVSLAIIRDGKIVYRKAFGVQNVETGKKLTTKTVFEAASLSKPVFAYFVMQQVQQSVLDLDRPVYEYLPNEHLVDDPRHKLITARMLLTHTSGLPNWRSDTGGKLKLLFTPGTEFQYSGEGYEYLRQIIQHLLAVDDDGLQARMQKEVVATIGAEFMQYTWDNTLPARKTFGHRNGKTTDNTEHDKNFGAAYSLHTTPTDYAKFLLALMRPSPENKALVETFLALQTKMPHEAGEMHRSLGFPVKRSEKGLRYYHSGNSGDFRSYCHFYPATGDGIVIFGNSDNLFSSNLAEYIVEYLGDQWFYM